MSDIDTDNVTKRATIAALGLAAISFAVPGPAQAQQDFSKIEMKTDLDHSTYMLEGQGGNITLIVNASASCGLEKQKHHEIALTAAQCVCDRRRR